MMDDSTGDTQQTFRSDWAQPCWWNCWETNGMKWKMIINEAENPDNDKYGFAAINNDVAEVKILEDSMMITSGRDINPHRDTTKSAEPPLENKHPQLTPTEG